MHVPVLKREVLAFMNPKPGGRYIDATVGSGGHAAALLEQSSPSGRLLGLDRDADALARAREVLRPFAGRFHLAHGNFADLADLARRHGFDRADGILLDLGVSSEQIETPDRGFSFLFEGPLDMRMDRSQPLTVEQWLRQTSEEELTRVLQEYGEVPRPRRIARAVLEAFHAGRLRTTTDLAAVAAAAVGGRRGPRHPATRVFQALRIAVNREIECLARALPAALDLLAPGGRLAVISFHSLEDRLVKRFSHAHAGRWERVPGGGKRWVGERPRVEILTRKPVMPSDDERAVNPRCRSAKLRVVARLPQESAEGTISEVTP